MGRLIDADKLKQHYAWWKIGDGEITYAEAKERFDTIIDVQPTVDAEKHGHWEKPQRHGVISYDEHAYAECSCCHKAQYLARGMNYCPNCGAKMDEDSNTHNTDSTR